jgi:uncharacterized protein YggE
MENLFKKIMFGLLSLFLVLLSIVSLMVISRLFNHQPVWLGQPATVSVSGTGKLQYTPDLATISVAVIAKGKDPVQVQDENNRNMQGVISYLKTSGIPQEDIQTTSYNLYPEYSYTDRGTDTSKIIGYTLHQSIVFKVRKDLTKVGSLIGGLTEAGANSIDSIEFSLSEEAKKDLEAEAKTKAISEAQSRLTVMRQSLKFRVLRLVSIQDSPIWSDNLFRTYSLKDVEGVGGGAPAPIELGSGEVVSNITLTFEIR